MSRAPRAYYNEIDPYAAQWIRNLIKAGLVTDGEVDARSIVDVRPSDLVGFDRCHFFSGIAVWDYALNLAGWPDDGVTFTGSCPCQPFSAAGKRGGIADERHLWPEFFRLIAECRPATVLGEQVASKDGLNWLDLVQTDLEGAGYAVGAADLCAAGVGAPHIRQRLWFVAGNNMAHPSSEQCARALQEQGRESGLSSQGVSAGGCGDAGLLADANAAGHERRTSPAGSEARTNARVAGRGAVGLLGDACAQGLSLRQRKELPGEGRWDEGRAVEQPGRTSSVPANADMLQPEQPAWSGPGSDEAQGGRALSQSAGRGDSGHFWSDADWIPCRDGKARPVEPGTFPLAHGVTNRVGRLRAYGNAINAEAARAFIEAVMESRP